MKSCAALVVALCVCTVASAGEVDATIDLNDQKVMSSEAFLDAHPDMKYRTEGWFAYQEGRYGDAREHFLHAASFADKLSQAMLAEMHWKGLGTGADRAIAYAWADLAAERGYVQFVALRERYWQALSEQERERAVTQGIGLLETYADAVALPRMADHLRRGWRRMISNRLRRDAMIMVPGEKGALRIRGWDFYAAKFWEPERYQAWVDERWSPLPSGEVDVRELEVVEAAAEQ